MNFYTVTPHLADTFQQNILIVKPEEGMPTPQAYKQLDAKPRPSKDFRRFIEDAALGHGEDDGLHCLARRIFAPTALSFFSIAH